MPDIFTSQDTWCKVGCSPIPEDSQYYWKAEYPHNAVNTEAKAAPVNINPLVYIKIGCRDGYTQKRGTYGATVSQCNEAGWIEPLSSFLTCVPGCPDITTTENNRVAVYAQHATTDAAFIVGDTVEFYCQNSLNLLGNSTVTCSSLNTWDKPLPECVNKVTHDNYHAISLLMTVFFMVQPL